MNDEEKNNLPVKTRVTAKVTQTAALTVSQRRGCWDKVPIFQLLHREPHEGEVCVIKAKKGDQTIDLLGVEFEYTLPGQEATRIKIPMLGVDIISREEAATA